MSKGYDIKHSIVHACKQHGTGLQLAIDLNWAILNDLDWVDDDDEEISQHESVFKMWKEYDKKCEDNAIRLTKRLENGL